VQIWNVDPDKAHNRHLCYIRISEQALADMFTTGRSTTVVSGLPEGAVLAGVAYDFQAMEFMLRFYHPSFEPTLEGERIPHLDIVVEQV
jgi:hypothetical protein